MTTPEFPRTSGKHTSKHPHAQGALKLHAWGCMLFSNNQFQLKLRESDGLQQEDTRKGTMDQA